MFRERRHERRPAGTDHLAALRDDAVEMLEYPRRQKLLEDWTGQIDLGAFRRQPTYQGEFGTCPADAKPAPDGLAQGADRDRLPIISRRHRRRRHLVETELHERFVDHDIS